MATWISLVLAILVAIGGAIHYLRTQRPKIGLHPDTRLVQKSQVDDRIDHYQFGFVFENKGTMECKTLDVFITLFTTRGKSGTTHRHTAVAKMPGDVFNELFEFDLIHPPKAEGYQPGNLLFLVELRYPAFLFGKHAQTMYLEFDAKTQKVVDCDLPEIRLIDGFLVKQGT